MSPSLSSTFLSELCHGYGGGSTLDAKHTDDSAIDDHDVVRLRFLFFVCVRVYVSYSDSESDLPGEFAGLAIE